MVNILDRAAWNSGPTPTSPRAHSANEPDLDLDDDDLEGEFEDEFEDDDEFDDDEEFDDDDWEEEFDEEGLDALADD